MSIVDVLTCTAAFRIQLHGVACPCLSSHEISLLNALAHLQDERDACARRCLEEIFFGGPAVRFVFPAMRAIVRDLDEQGLRLSLLERAPDAAPLQAQQSAMIH